MQQIFSHRKHRGLWNAGNAVIRTFIYAGLATFSIAYAPLLGDGRNMPKMYLLYAIVLIAVATAVILLIFLPSVAIRRTVFDVPLLLLFLSALFASIASKQTHISLWGRPDFFVLHALSVCAWVLWTWFIIQTIEKPRHWETAGTLLIIGAGLAGALFVSGGIRILGIQLPSNIAATQYSNLSVMLGAVLVLAMGMLGLIKHIVRKSIAGAAAIAALAGMIKLGFASGWIITAIGTALLLIFAVVRWHKENVPYFVALFCVFAAGFIFSIIQTPTAWRAELPAEIALSRETSWDIARQTIFSGGSYFLLGSGLGTFSYDFSQFRSESFNRTTIADGVNFFAPYSSALAFLPEAGVIGTLILAIIIVLALGTVPLLLSNRIQPSASRGIVNLLDEDSENYRWQIASTYAAWLSLTLGLFLTYFEASLWWMWWSLLSLLLSGFGVLGIKRLSHETVLPVAFKHPYTLVKSFGLVVVLGGSVGLAVFLTRLYLAENHFVRAQMAPGYSAKRAELTAAVSLRERFTPYGIALSELALSRAAELSNAEPIDSSAIMSELGEAISRAKTATEKDPENFRVWQQAGVVYLNAGPIVDGAYEWARQSFERAIALAPSNPTLHWQMGNTYAQLKNTDEAQKSYREAIRLKPDFLPAYMHLVRLLEGEKLLNDALAVYRDIDLSGQRNSDILFDYGRLFYNRGEPSDIANAEVAWLEAVKINPNFSNALFSLGALYEREGERGKALEFYQRVAELNPDNEEIQAKIRSLIRSR